MKRWLRKLTITQMLHRAKKEGIGKKERKSGLDAVFPHEALSILILDSDFTSNLQLLVIWKRNSDRTHCV